MAYIVAIDGPAGSGKGTVTELVAKKLGLVNIGSGSAYRCVALETINKGIDLKEKEKIINLLDEIEIEFKMENSKDIVYLNGKDVTSRIREKDVAKIVSFVSSIKEVRFAATMYFTNGSSRAFEMLMRGKPGFDRYENGGCADCEDCNTCHFYRPHWKYQFCVYAECPYEPGKLTALRRGTAK